MKEENYNNEVENQKKCAEAADGPGFHPTGTRKKRLAVVMTV